MSDIDTPTIPPARSCCCRSDDPAECLQRRCGPSEDYDGRPEECSCSCHDDYGYCPECGDRWWDCACEPVMPGEDVTP